jgi:hypothetical protein
METPHRKDCSQGLAHIYKDLFHIQKWVLKYKYRNWRFKKLSRSQQWLRRPLQRNINCRISGIFMENLTGVLVSAWWAALIPVPARLPTASRSSQRLYHTATLLCRCCPSYRVYRIIGNFGRRTPVGELHVTCKIPYVYEYVNKQCRP